MVSLSALVFACPLPRNCTLCCCNTANSPIVVDKGQYLILSYLLIHILLATISCSVVHIYAVWVGGASASPPTHYVQHSRLLKKIKSWWLSSSQYKKYKKTMRRGVLQTSLWLLYVLEIWCWYGNIHLGFWRSQKFCVLLIYIES